jgi:hypothetical protein
MKTTSPGEGQCRRGQGSGEEDGLMAQVSNCADRRACNLGEKVLLANLLKQNNCRPDRHAKPDKT